MPVWIPLFVFSLKIIFGFLEIANQTVFLRKFTTFNKYQKKGETRGQRSSVHFFIWHMFDTRTEFGILLPGIICLCSTNCLLFRARNPRKPENWSIYGFRGFPGPKTKNSKIRFLTYLSWVLTFHISPSLGKSGEKPGRSINFRDRRWPKITFWDNRNFI